MGLTLLHSTWLSVDLFTVGRKSNRPLLFRKKNVSEINAFQVTKPSHLLEKKLVLTQPGSKVSIEISYKIEAFGHAYLVHCTKLFHSRGGHFNSLILQALELFPARAKRATPGTIGQQIFRPEPRSVTRLVQVYLPGICHTKMCLIWDSTIFSPESFQVPLGFSTP